MLDIGLPKLDGHKVARELRHSPETTYATLIAITGYGQDDDRRKAFAASFDHFIVKPADPEALEQLLEDIAASQGGAE